LKRAGLWREKKVSQKGRGMAERFAESDQGGILKNKNGLYGRDFPRRREGDCAKGGKKTLQKEKELVRKRTYPISEKGKRRSDDLMKEEIVMAEKKDSWGEKNLWLQKKGNSRITKGRKRGGLPKKKGRGYQLQRANASKT